MAYVLLNKLPFEIVYYIYIIIKKDKSEEIISKYIKIINNKNNLIKNLLNYKAIIDNNINYILNNNNNFYNNNCNNNNNNFYYNMISLLSKENYILIKSLYKNSLNRNRIFWLQLMNLFGEKLNSIRNFIIINKIKLSYSNKFYYNKIIYYWNRICIKFNLKLKVYVKNKKLNNYLHIKLSARKLFIKKNMFINYKILYFPIILDDNYNSINYLTSLSYINNNNKLNNNNELNNNNNVINYNENYNNLIT